MLRFEPHFLYLLQINPQRPTVMHDTIFFGLRKESGQFLIASIETVMTHSPFLITKKALL